MEPGLGLPRDPATPDEAIRRALDLGGLVVLGQLGLAHLGLVSAWASRRRRLRRAEDCNCRVFNRIKKTTTRFPEGQIGTMDGFLAEAREEDAAFSR